MSYEYNASGLGTNDDSAKPSETVFEQGWELLREVAGAKDSQPAAPQVAPMPGATPGGKASAENFSSYAREAAVREVAVVDEQMAPIEETPRSDEPDERSGIERYQTHITLISTVVGLGSFIVWLLIRKKDRRR